MDRNLIIQYTLVGVILLVAIIWIVIKVLFSKNKNKCCGCGLSDKCSELKSTKIAKKRYNADGVKHPEL